VHDIYAASGDIAARQQPHPPRPQAAALPQLCSQLTLASGLRELVLDLHGRAAYFVPIKFAELGRLTQLDSLQLSGVAIDVKSRHLAAALQPLTRLKQLGLRFDYDHWDRAEGHTAFPWEEAVCGLTNLQELRICSESADDYCAFTMFKGSLPAAITLLTALRHFEVNGMAEWDARDGSDQLQLAALPALERATLRMYTLCGQYPGLCSQEVVLSRLVSLSLGLRVNIEMEESYADTQLPTIVAPALTELVLDDIKLAPDSEQLSWLPRMPSLRRLVLKDVKTASSQLPQGIMACSGLTELVLKRILISFTDEPDRFVHRPDCCLRSLPAAGPYLSRLIRLSLVKNAFDAVPLCLAAATALEQLDLAKQEPWDKYVANHMTPVQGLHVLDNLTRLRQVNLIGFRKGAAGLRRFRAAHPSVAVII